MWILSVVLWTILCYMVMNAVYNKTVGAQIENIIKPSEKECPPHRWRSKKQPGSDQDYLQCEICEVFPGYTDNR